MSWLLFVAKKVVSAFIYPLGASLLLWLIGIICWRRRPRSYAGPALVTIGAVWLLLMSMPVTGFLLLHSLEAQAGRYADPTELSRDGVKFIVVLGGDLRAGKLTSADRIAYTSLVRLMEAIRLWKKIPGSRLVLSGGRVSEKTMTCAEGMALLAEELGVPRDAIILEAKSWDTEEEASLLKPILGENRFALVTAARHIPRSMMLFRAKGLNPIPAPADFETEEFIFMFNSLLPKVHGLEISQDAIHEYLGICVAMIRQSILR
jgi:uncharacterized SAM-binding protein YcdF (DUF218 family)